MRTSYHRRCALAGVFFCVVSFYWALQVEAQSAAKPPRPQGPCDIYAQANDPCVAAHSTTRALYASYSGPLYQILRQSDGKTLDIDVVQPSASPVADPGGYANASVQDAFCENTYCWISKIYDQSPSHNDLTQAPRGGFSGPALGGFNNLPIADMAPVTVMGHKVYGVFIEPGMGLRQDDVRGTAVDDQAEGQYWVVNGQHFNSGCCFDYGNAEIDSRDDDNGTMETAYFGNATPWFSGSGLGPWIMTDQENNLVGCVNVDGSKGCPNLPSIPWRFVTAIANGEPHHWVSMGGNAQTGSLSVMFDGARVNATYDPMRKQGAILLGNGGDNSNSSQGTFYEGAMTAAGTFPSIETEQKVQANIIASHYDVPPLSLSPVSAKSNPPGLQTFTPGSTQNVILTFTNTTGASVTNVRLNLVPPSTQWTASAESGNVDLAASVAAGASVSATFRVVAGKEPFNGDLVGKASWKDSATGREESERVAEKIRNVSPIKLNEFRIGSSTGNATDSFIEIYNGGAKPVDLSNWTLTVHPTQKAIFSRIAIPSGVKLAPRGFYLLGLTDSGLVIPSQSGDAILYVRNTEGMSVGDTITVDNGSNAETRKVLSVGTAATENTTLWQPLPDGPILTIPVGSTNVPVTSTVGFAVGQKIAIGFGATYPDVARTIERYEVATVTAVGKPGTQAFLAEDAPAGVRTVQVTDVENISVGDQIRLDVDSMRHGIETVTVTRVGTKAKRTNLDATADAGATSIHVRNGSGFAVGDKVTIGTLANHESVTIASIDLAARNNMLRFTPALKTSHFSSELVVDPGTGLDLAAPLKFNHASNLPFSVRGTGISFKPATRFAHSSNEPVQAVGTGITLDRPLQKSHGIDAGVRDASAAGAGYQGNPSPDQWFGGPELTSKVPYFERTVARREGALILRDASGLVVDSLNYGLLVEPWAAEGYQASSGKEQSGCYVPTPGEAMVFGPEHPGANATNISSGRYPDGADSDSNCTDFLRQATATLLTGSLAGADNLKVSRVDGFEPGQEITIGSGQDLESATIASVGTAGATRLLVSAEAGDKHVSAAEVIGFRNGETVIMGQGTEAETVTIANVRRFETPEVTLTAPLVHAHAAQDPVVGTGITLRKPLKQTHVIGAQITNNEPTPGAPNRYLDRAD